MINRTSLQKILNLSIVCGGLCFIAPSLAQEKASSDSDFKVTGFLSIVGGGVTAGKLDSNYVGPPQLDGHNCPCYVADFNNGGTYTKTFSLKPESRAGIQANYQATTNLSFVGQVTIRGTDATPSIQWAYGAYKLDKNWEIQIGRKRIPLYYYSDFQDIGVAYPWINPPPELYGWEVTNYNGGSIRYNNSIGDTTVNASVFAGTERNKNSLYEKLFYSGRNEAAWRKIIGGDVEFSRDFFTVRGIYLQADASLKVFDSGIDTVAQLQAYGLAANLDFEKWFVLSELTQVKRMFKKESYAIRSPAWTLGVGLRLGSWTPFINYASYKDHTNDLRQYSPQIFRRTSATLRYDVDASSAIKAQIDRYRDVGNLLGGNNTVLRISYDRVF